MRNEPKKETDHSSLPDENCTTRYESPRRRAESMRMFLEKRSKTDPTVAPFLRRLKSCGLELKYSRRSNGSKRLSGGRFCQHFFICPLCAMRRTIKLAYTYAERVFHVLQDYPEAQLYFVGLTLRPSRSLPVDVARIQEYTTQLHKLGRDIRRGKRSIKKHSTEAAKIIASLQSIIIAEQNGNNLLRRPWRYMVRAHAIWLCDTPPRESLLSEEWRGITGGSFVVNIQDIKSNDKAVDYNAWLDSVGENLFAVCSYMLAASHLHDALRWDIFRQLKAASGRSPRLLVSRGEFYGVKLPDEEGPLSEGEQEFEKIYFLRWDREQWRYRQVNNA